MRASQKPLENLITLGAMALFGGCVAPQASADVFNMPAGQTSLQFVTVGDPGNAPDTTGFGSVPYTYQMGEFDVTAAQYTQFLNAVAKTDPYGLYNSGMNPPAPLGHVELFNPVVLVSMSTAFLTLERIFRSMKSPGEMRHVLLIGWPMVNPSPARKAPGRPRMVLTCSMEP